MRLGADAAQSNGSNQDEHRAQGNCFDPPTFTVPGQELLRLRTAQCLLVLAGPLLADGPISRGQLWLDNIYARVQRSSRQVMADEEDLFLLTMLISGDGTRQVLLTNVTLQNGPGYAVGVFVSAADVVIRGACASC